MGRFAPALQHATAQSIEIHCPIRDHHVSLLKSPGYFVSSSLVFDLPPVCLSVCLESDAPPMHLTASEQLVAKTRHLPRLHTFFDCTINSACPTSLILAWTFSLTGKLLLPCWQMRWSIVYSRSNVLHHPYHRSHHALIQKTPSNAYRPLLAALHPFFVVFMT